MKDTFARPTMTVLRHDGAMTNEQLAALPDEELEQYLRNCSCCEDERLTAEMSKS